MSGVFGRIPIAERGGMLMYFEHKFSVWKGAAPVH
jgi:hypothetical protein